MGLIQFLVNIKQTPSKMKQNISIIASLLFGLCGADHVPSHHQSVHHPVHHQAVHHPVHHQAVHHPTVHHQAAHHPVHHQAVHHQAVHHPEPVVQAYQPTEDVVDIAVGNKDFSTLVKIVSDLGLVDTLKNAEAVTIFAPNDAAFAKLPEGTLESLTPEQAKEIVLRHVVAAKVVAADVLASNGVIHVIDNVILPAPAAKAAPELGDVVDVAVADGRFTTL